MVSLGRNFNINSGARFLGDTSNMDDDNQHLFEPVLATDNDHFKPLKTIPTFSLHIFISTLISVSGIVFAIVLKDDKRCEAYFFMLYLRVFFWLITFMFDHIIKYHHNKLRLNGYHEFHRATAVQHRIPLYIVSLWNTTILGVQALMQHYYGEHFGEHCLEAFFSPIVYISMFCSLETIVLAAVHGSYIAEVKKFNRVRPHPDALRGSYSIGHSVGLTQRGADVAELLEKQADLISYLQDHNLKLNEKLMQMNAQVRTVTLPPMQSSQHP